jgi:alkylation response protein AidB-like acyl-CoA dehydrogenase
VLNGTKAWVTSGTHADVFLAQVRTDTPEARRGSRGISTFILTPDLPGFKVGKKEDKMGLRASPTVQVVLDNCRVPASRMVGEEGQGFVYAMQSLDNGRMGIAAQSIGIARAALEASLAYAAERRQFGKAIREFEAIQFKLAEMGTRITAARSVLHQAAMAKDRGEKVTMYGAMAKFLASDTAMWATTQAEQIFGGYGYVTDYPVERFFRDAKVTEIYEGTNEIQRIVIARELYT